MNVMSDAVDTGTKTSDFSARFSYLRKVSGLSQREIADKLGISNRAVRGDWMLKIKFTVNYFDFYRKKSYNEKNFYGESYEKI